MTKEIDYEKLKKEYMESKYYRNKNKGWTDAEIAELKRMIAQKIDHPVFLHSKGFFNRSAAAIKQKISELRNEQKTT